MKFLHWYIFRIQLAFALISKRDDFEITHLLEMVTALKMPLQIGADGASVCISIGMQQVFFGHYDIENVTDISCSPSGKQIWRDMTEI